MPKSKLPTVEACCEIIFKEFQSSDFLINYYLNKFLMTSNIYFPQSLINADSPKIINGFLDSLIKFDISCFPSIIFLIMFCHLLNFYMGMLNHQHHLKIIFLYYYLYKIFLFLHLILLLHI